MEHLLDEFTVFLVDAVIIFIVALPGIIAYNVQKKLDKKRDRKRGRYKALLEKKKGEGIICQKQHLTKVV